MNTTPTNITLTYKDEGCDFDMEFIDSEALIIHLNFLPASTELVAADGRDWLSVETYKGMTNEEISEHLKKSGVFLKRKL